MCMCLMWKLKGYGPPTPREIRHLYTLRQAGHGGTYFLLSSLVKNRIPKGMANPGQVEISSDEKKKASSRCNLLVKKVPKHFTSPEAWSKAVPVLLDGEVSHLAAAAVLPLDLRDRSFLLDEEKMIPQRVFPRQPARLPRLCDFDTVCDLQARVVENSEAASKRHAAGLAKEGIASPDGGDPSDGEEAGDVTGGGVESGQPHMCTEVTANTLAATTPSRKGKEKVGVSRGASDIPIFDADVTEALDPANDLAPRAGKGKRPVESTPDHAARPPKRASRVVQYVVSSDEEGADKPAFAEAPSTQTAVREDLAKGTNAVVPPPEEVNEINIPAPTPPRTAAPPVAMGESNVPSNQPRPSGRPKSVDRPGPSKQPGTSASSSGVAHEAPPAGPTKADEGTVSLSDFSATEICSHLINNDMYIGEGWEHVKGKSYNRKMEFFFNCHSLLAENYKYGNKASREIKRLPEQTSTLAAVKLSTEESHAAEEKLSAAKEEIRSLNEHLSASQESFAARLEAERVAEEAKEKAEHEALDLRNQLSSRELIFDNLKVVLEVEVVDHFKKSPAYDAFLLREFERGMR
ncbi:hypothetical protein LWI29_030418 [Acer saccharum]|uniref:Uncharacterized protein n=1 Tax=Acer saccharum TaxID=4024 RepID=A0AA39RKG4_ACESA|nr:hypothetical protein LWI29_030418 [Acer saccharum]